MDFSKLGLDEKTLTDKQKQEIIKKQKEVDDAFEELKKLNRKIKKEREVNKMTIITGDVIIKLDKEEKEILDRAKNILSEIADRIMDMSKEVNICTEDKEMDLFDEIFDSIDIIEDNMSRR